MAVLVGYAYVGLAGRSGKFVPKVAGTDWHEFLYTAVQPDNKIIVVGTMNFNAGAQWNPDDPQFAVDAHFLPTLHRLSADGSLDTTFGAGGFIFIDYPGLTGFDSEATHVVLLADGSFLVATNYYQTSVVSKDVLAKFTANGLLDPTFGTNGLFSRDQAALGYVGGCRSGLQSDGSIVLYSTVRVPATWGVLYGLTSGGVLKTGWGNSSGAGDGIFLLDLAQDTTPTTVCVLSNDKILIGAISGSFGAPQQFLTVRVNANGTLDTGFGASGYAYVDFPFHLDCQPNAGFLIQNDGKIVVGGLAAYDGSNHTAIALCRLSADGVLDTSFGVDSGMTYVHGGSLIHDRCFNASIFYDASGRIIVAGETNTDGALYHSATMRFIIARFTANGIPDTTFNATGFKEVDFDGTLNQEFYSGALHQGKYLFCGHGNGEQNHGAGHVGGGSLATIIRTSTAGVLDQNFGQQAGFGYGTAPSVTTNAASSVGSTTTTANATINPQGNSTSWRFVYGKATGKYHYRSVEAVVGLGSSGVAVSASLTGLTGGTPYYGRAIGYSTVGGHALGAEVTWTTS